ELCWLKREVRASRPRLPFVLSCCHHSLSSGLITGWRRPLIRYANPERNKDSIGSQHLAVLRFLPIAPRFWTFRMYSPASGTLHVVLPISTKTGPILSAAFKAGSVSPRT